MINISETQYGGQITCNVARKFYVAYNKDLKQCVKTSNTSRLDYNRFEDCEYAIKRSLANINSSLLEVQRIIEGKDGRGFEPKYIPGKLKDMDVAALKKLGNKYKYVEEVLEGCEVILVNESSISSVVGGE